MHTFEISGLGKAPFTIVEPKIHAIEKGCIFWCEHCGTQIKNRHFVKSADSKVSVVGIDCLKKTGDEGLIAGEKRIRKAAREAARTAEWEAKQAEREADERAANNGKTKAELIEELTAELDSRIRGFIESIEENKVILSLTQMGFELDMQHQAFLVNPYSPGQLNVIKKIHTKKISNARANSKAFKEASVDGFAQVDELQQAIIDMKVSLEPLREKIMQLKVG